MRRSFSLACCAFVGAFAVHASAQLELGSALRSLQRSGTRELPRALSTAGDRVALLAEYPAASGLSELLVDGRYRPIWLTRSELTSFVDDQPEVKLHWAPPRRTLLDNAQRWVGAESFRNATGLTGKGVVVGIIDTGLDVRHGDLRAADGASRVRYLMDFRGRLAIASQSSKKNTAAAATRSARSTTTKISTS